LQESGIADVTIKQSVLSSDSTFPGTKTQITVQNYR